MQFYLMKILLFFCFVFQTACFAAEARPVMPLERLSTGLAVSPNGGENQKIEYDEKTEMYSYTYGTNSDELTTLIFDLGNKVKMTLQAKALKEEQMYKYVYEIAVLPRSPQKLGLTTLEFTPDFISSSIIPEGWMQYGRPGFGGKNTGFGKLVGDFALNPGKKVNIVVYSEKAPVLVECFAQGRHKRLMFPAGEVRDIEGFRLKQNGVTGWTIGPGELKGAPSVELQKLLDAGEKRQWIDPSIVKIVRSKLKSKSGNISFELMRDISRDLSTSEPEVTAVMEHILSIAELQ